MSLDLREYGMHCIAVFSASRLPTRITSFLAHEIAVYSRLRYSILAVAMLTGMRTVSYWLP